MVQRLFARLTAGTLKMPSPSSKNRFLLLFGSETGQAQAIAEEINESAAVHGLAPELHCLSSTDKKFSIEKESCVVMVVSTTGEGDPPETAQKFWRRLKKKTIPNDYLKKLNYALLALGDSNYTNFCDNGKKFDKRLEALGGRRFYPTAYADDAVGLEVVVEPWIEGLWPALKNQLGLGGIDREVKKLKLENGDAEGTTESRLTRGNLTGAEDEGASQSNESSGEKKGTEKSDPSRPQNELTNGANKHDTELTDTGQERASTLTSKSPLPDDNTDGTELSQRADKSGDMKREISDISSMSQVDEELSSSPGPPRENSELHERDALATSEPPLCNSALTLPMNPASFLEIVFHEELDPNVLEGTHQNDHPFPSAASPVTMATVTRATRLTGGDAERKTLELQLKSSEALDYQPGDAFGVVCPNRSEEVDALLARLGVAEKSDIPFTLKLEAGTRKRRAVVPEFINFPSTLRRALTHCYDIRNPPKKAFIRMLSEHTNDSLEKRRLHELCSKEGAQDYNRFIRRGHLALIDLLDAFPTCQPPVERVLEHLTRLLPRPYSVASSPLQDSMRVCFAFNVLQFPGTQIKPAQSGLCSGWLDKITSLFQDDGSSSDGQESMEPTAEVLEIPVYFRTNTTFRLPEDTTRPVIMIGPGTGVAPFIGFMEHRQLMRDKLRDDDSSFGMMWLFFGCRYRDKDFLYRDKIYSFVEDGILSKLSVSFSRQASDDDSDENTRYVQDSMRQHKQQLAELVMDKGAVVYVCGDADGMAKDVMAAWTEILCEHTGKTAFEVTVLLATLREEGRYLQDVWT